MYTVVENLYKSTRCHWRPRLDIGFSAGPNVVQNEKLNKATFSGFQNTELVHKHGTHFEKERPAQLTWAGIFRASDRQSRRGPFCPMRYGCANTASYNPSCSFSFYLRHYRQQDLVMK